MSSLPEGYGLIPVAPSPQRYRELRRSCGLSAISEAQAARAIEGSWAWLSVISPAGETVGMGRIVGDDGWYFLISDMATLPEHQGKGLGRAVLTGLLDRLRAGAEPGAYVTLTADPPGRRLYESEGFVDVAPLQTGMAMVL